MFISIVLLFHFFIKFIHIAVSPWVKLFLSYSLSAKLKIFSTKLGDYITQRNYNLNILTALKGDLPCFFVLNT